MNLKRAVAAGLVGTAVMTCLMLVAPVVGLPRLAIGQLLSTLLAVSTAFLPIGPGVGWALHVAFGALLAIIYAAAFAGRLPGRPLARGALYGVLVFVLAQLTFMPLVGAGVFSRGDVPMILGSLLGHLVYGGLVGIIYGEPASAASVAPKPA
jgi:uncharacterized membrane protein YagU involved in acid resistance